MNRNGANLQLRQALRAGGVINITWNVLMAFTIVSTEFENALVIWIRISGDSSRHGRILNTRLFNSSTMLLSRRMQCLFSAMANFVLQHCLIQTEKASILLKCFCPRTLRKVVFFQKKIRQLNVEFILTSVLAQRPDPRSTSGLSSDFETRPKQL